MNLRTENKAAIANNSFASTVARKSSSND